MAENRSRYTEFAVLDDPSLPERFQNYIIDKNKIGEGPLAFCYRAQRLDTSNSVRLKVFRRRLSQDSEIRDQLAAHAKMLSHFQGSNIQAFNAISFHDQNLILEFDYIDAVSLRAIISENAPLHPDLVALLAMAITRALNQVHGIRPSPGMGNLIPLHKNLKPENILISYDGKVYLTDIDMLPYCHLADRKKLVLPYSDEIYESPEQLLRNGYADRRSDLFALGLIMLEMATGRYPYPGSNVYEVRQNVRENHREAPNALYPNYRESASRDLCRELARLIEKAIDSNPDKRIQTPLDLEGQLDDYFKGSAYDYPEKTLADFLRIRSFHMERARKRGFIDRLLGG